MKIDIVVNPIYDGWSPTDIRLGGSEETVLEWAKELTSRHHSVRIFSNFREYDDTHLPYEDYGKDKPDVTINVNYPQFPTLHPSVYWSSLTDNPDLSQFDAVCVLSEYAKKHTNIHRDVHIVPPGYDPENIKPGDKVEKQCFYASSPDRGLDILLKAWPQVYEAHPDATLLLTYGGYAPQDGIINLGECDEETMNDIYQTSDIWCHPCNGGELYCMTGKKAQISGCIPVIIPTMALAETVERGFKVEKPEDYAQSLIEVLDFPMHIRASIRKDIIEHANAKTWKESTNILLEVIDSVILN